MEINWNIDQIASVATIVESLAVFVSIIFIFLQLKQTNQINRTDSYLELTGTFNQLFASIAQDQELSRIYSQGRIDPSVLTTDEKERLFFVCATVLSFHESLFLLKAKRVIPEDFYEGWKRDLQKNLEQAGYIAYWDEQKDEFSPKFRNFVDSLTNHTHQS